MTQFVHI